MIKFIRGLSSNLECKPGKPPKKRTKYQNLNVKGKMATKIIYSHLVTIMIMYTCALTTLYPFYQAKIAKVVSQRVLDISTSEGCPQVEPSTIQNGIIKSVGNVANFATWTNTL